eukprot:scaffold3276_cov168-Amphora_coffeaeformis.AAC.9
MVRQSYRPLFETEERISHSHGWMRSVAHPERDRSEVRLGINRRQVPTGRSHLFGDFSKKGESELGKNQRSLSNGRGDNPLKSERVIATVSNRRAISGGRPGLYEREIEHKAKRDAKLQTIRKQMMEECTFTPKTLNSISSASRTASTNASSETKGALEDVYERLYRHAGNVSTPHKVRNRSGSSSIYPSPSSNMSRTGSACSSRIEELYQEGKQKIRNRRLTEEQERALRERRREQQQILECTFRPKTHWARRVEHTDTGRIGISPRDRTILSPPVTRKKPTCPPQEIVVASPSDIRHWTPQRNRTSTTDYIMVSPLQDPSVFEDSRSIDDSTLLPRMQFIGSTVATSTAASVSHLTQTDETEYGSI